MSGFHVVIPARYASTRLPGKPLADLAGRAMILHVAERAAAAGADEVVVATDDARVADAVRAAGMSALMTRADHPSGSDRVMEVAEIRGWPDDAIVINVQGDEPLIPPEVVSQLARMLQADAGLGAATLCEPITDRRTLFDPNVVKVVSTRSTGHALYFSRAPIPFARDAFGGDLARAAAADEPLPEPNRWWRHIGVYAFRVATLRRFVGLPMGLLERLESLEQLRLLEQGIAIRVEEAAAPVPGGVDTPEDLERVRRILAR